MTPRKLTLTRTIQVRQYEPLSVAIEGELDDGEDANSAARELLDRVRALLWEASGHSRAEFAPPSTPPELPF